MNSLLDIDNTAVGREMHELMTEMYPICRSITGDGVRRTHDLIRQHIPVTTHEVPTGTEVFDWIVPKEWSVREAYIKGPDGKKVVDYRDSNLHLVNYSVPVHAKIPLRELIPHLHSLPDRPESIPYLTTYYKEDWGFCLTHRQLAELPEGEYEVFIDSALENGHLTYSECFLEGEQDDEVLVSCYTCHPSLCNDNLSGVVLATFLAKHLRQMRLTFSYRFLFIPETVGAIAWLCINEANLNRIKHGLVATCVGDPGRPTYKKSRNGNAEIDRAVIHVLKSSGQEYDVLDFFPSGSDERQFCSPAFNLPVGSLMRTPYGRFPEYHTSADNLEFVQPQYLGASLAIYLSVIYVLENNRTYLNLSPKGEPQLGRRGLYRNIAVEQLEGVDEMAILWVLNMSDGVHSLLDIAERSGKDFQSLRTAADVLLLNGLLAEAGSLGARSRT